MGQRNRGESADQEGQASHWQASSKMFVTPWDRITMKNPTLSSTPAAAMKRLLDMPPPASLGHSEPVLRHCFQAMIPAAVTAASDTAVMSRKNDCFCVEHAQSTRI